MTALSTLFPAAGGGVSVSMKSNRWYPIHQLMQLNLTGGMAANRDYLFPFIPRADVTVDEVGWIRANATAANVYVGIYDLSGNLLTDCAVDSGTGTGLRAVSTTAFDLTGGETYLMAANQSAAVINSDLAANTDNLFPNQYLGGIMQFGWDTASGASFPSSFVHEQTSGGIYKSRSNAALSDPLTISGCTNAGQSVVSMGLIPQ